MASSASLLLNMATDVLGYHVFPFLTDMDAVRLARCTSTLLKLLQHAPYLIKRMFHTPIQSDAAAMDDSTESRFRFGQVQRICLEFKDATTSVETLILKIRELPASVTDLGVAGTFKYLLDTPELLFPEQLKTLCLHGFDTDMPHYPRENNDTRKSPLIPYFPSTLTDLTLPMEVRGESLLPTHCPGSVHTMHYGDFYWQFPPALTDLNVYVGSGDEAWLSSLPNTLKRVVFRVLGEGMAELIACLPSSLEDINFQCFSCNFDGIRLPPSLRVLRITDDYNLPLVHWKPPVSLEVLQLSDDWNLELSQLRLPDTLRCLMFGSEFNQPIHTSFRWPSHLRELHLGGSFDQRLDHVCWPESLTALTLSDQWNLPCTQLRLPPNLRNLRFGRYFNRSVNALKLPASLRWLGFGVCFNQPVVGRLRLPDGLQQLHFGVNYDNGWRQNNACFVQRLRRMKWPSALKQLFLPACWQRPAELDTLPRSLEALHCFATPNEEAQWDALADKLPTCNIILRTKNNSDDQMAWELCLDE